MYYHLVMASFTIIYRAVHLYVIVEIGIYLLMVQSYLLQVLKGNLYTECINKISASKINYGIEATLYI